MTQKIIKRRTPTKGQYSGSKGLASRLLDAESLVAKRALPDYRPGDTVRAHMLIKEGDKERVQVYEGVVIAKGGRGANKSLTVRKISHGVGVERIFQETSPKLSKLEVVQSGKVRRAKLYYLRGLEGKAARLERSLDGNAVPAAGAIAGVSGTPSPRS